MRLTPKWKYHFDGIFVSGRTLQWRHNVRDGVSNHQPHGCWLNRLFRRRSKKASKLRVTGLWEGNSPVTGEFPAHRASNAENAAIWWRHHDLRLTKVSSNRRHFHFNEWYFFRLFRARQVIVETSDDAYVRHQDESLASGKCPKLSLNFH